MFAVLLKSLFYVSYKTRLHRPSPQMPLLPDTDDAERPKIVSVDAQQPLLGESQRIVFGAAWKCHQR